MLSCFVHISIYFWLTEWVPFWNAEIAQWSFKIGFSHLDAFSPWQPPSDDLELLNTKIFIQDPLHKRQRYNDKEILRQSKWLIKF